MPPTPQPTLVHLLPAHWARFRAAQMAADLFDVPEHFEAGEEACNLSNHNG
jgi:hypothetical protein